MRKLRFLLPAIIAALSLGGCDFISITDSDSGSGSSEVDDSTAVSKYYEGYNLNRTGGRLLQELQKMSFEKHTKWIQYGQVNTYYNKTSDHNSVEAVEEGSKVNQWFYTGKEKSGYGTREHVWPCANSGAMWVHDNPGTGSFSPHYVDNKYYVGGGSDLYHVRTANSAVNTARGNSRFCDFDDPEYEGYENGVVSYGENDGKWNIKIYGASKTSTGAYQYADRCEPDDNMKGDVARIIMYVYMHYTLRTIDIIPSGSITTHTDSKTGVKHTFKYTDMVGSLSLSSIMGYDSDARCGEVLTEWNRIDPPSKVEKLRNKTVQKLQGNRNPFVDYPDLVGKCFN